MIRYAHWENDERKFAIKSVSCMHLCSLTVRVSRFLTSLTQHPALKFFAAKPAASSFRVSGRGSHFAPTAGPRLMSCASALRTSCDLLSTPPWRHSAPRCSRSKHFWYARRAVGRETSSEMFQSILQRPFDGWTTRLKKHTATLRPT
jgi:hypothetical protein